MAQVQLVIKTVSFPLTQTTLADLDLQLTAVLATQRDLTFDLHSIVYVAATSSPPHLQLTFIKQ